ncbi:CPXV054 protein, partial [Monkeypox virus]
ESVYF